MITIAESSGFEYFSCRYPKFRGWFISGFSQELC
jgi:hypothetical protein